MSQYFFNDVIYSAQVKTSCPRCRARNWKFVQWQLPLRYSASSLLMFLTGTTSLTLLLCLYAENIFGIKYLSSFVLTTLGVLCAAVSTAVCMFLSYVMVFLVIVTKYCARDKRIEVWCCRQCSTTYIFISERSSDELVSANQQ